MYEFKKGDIVKIIDNRNFVNEISLGEYGVVIKESGLYPYILFENGNCFSLHQDRLLKVEIKRKQKVRINESISLKNLHDVQVDIIENEILDDVFQFIANHIMRKENFEVLYVSANTVTINVCDFEFTLPKILFVPCETLKEIKNKDKINEIKEQIKELKKQVEELE